MRIGCFGGRAREVAALGHLHLSLPGSRMGPTTKDMDVGQQEAKVT